MTFTARSQTYDQEIPAAYQPQSPPTLQPAPPADNREQTAGSLTEALIRERAATSLDRRASVSRTRSPACSTGPVHPFTPLRPPVRANRHLRGSFGLKGEAGGLWCPNRSRKPISTRTIPERSTPPDALAPWPAPTPSCTRRRDSDLRIGTLGARVVTSCRRLRRAWGPGRGRGEIGPEGPQRGQGGSHGGELWK